MTQQMEMRFGNGRVEVRVDGKHMQVKFTPWVTMRVLGVGQRTAVTLEVNPVTDDSFKAFVLVSEAAWFYPDILVGHGWTVTEGKASQ